MVKVFGHPTDTTKNVNDIRTRKLEPRAAALMGALMTADGAWSDPKISISIVRIPET